MISLEVLSAFTIVRSLDLFYVPSKQKCSAELLQSIKISVILHITNQSKFQSEEEHKKP